METSADGRRLIREWDTSGGMQADGGGGGEAGLHEGDTFIHFLRLKGTRPRRMAKFLAVALLLLLLAALALLFTALHRGRGQRAPDTQPTTQPSSDLSNAPQQQEDIKNPSAMLTAPVGKNILVSAADWTYLEWESESGNAFCHGGFNYSRGNLVVPTTGIYRVFLQITFESKEDNLCERDVLTFSCTVFALGGNYPDNRRLLSAVDTVSCGMEMWRKSLYTAGLFYLEANSRLRVTSSFTDYIVRGNEHEVFFGAELLPQ